MKNDWLLLGPNSPYRGGIAAFNDAIAFEIQKKYNLTIWNYKHLYPSFLFPGSSQFRPEINAKELGLRILHSTHPLQWESIRKQISKDKYEVILFPYWHPFFAPMLIRILPTNTKNIMFGHNILPHESFPFSTQLTKALLRKVTGVITLGKSELKQLQKLEYKGKMAYHLSPIYPEYVERFQKPIPTIELPIDKQYRKILFFGIIRPYKGLEVLLKALEMEKLNHVALIIAGEAYGNSKDLLEKVEKFKDRVYWINRYISDDEVPAIMQQAELVILPYLHATSTGVLPIAYCAGKPTIVTNVGGLPELVIKDYTGDIVPPNHPEALADAICKWLTNNELMQRARQKIPELLATMTFSELLRTIERELL
ncbi:MAG: glycosyltransferase family 4 protein [bacterium]|nr:glycosyltransferase family 4 protein [bacterium]